MAGLDPATAPFYEFRSEEIKQTAFRLDGVLAPREDGDEPWVFIEVQFQPDENFYRRLFAEIFLFLHRAPKARPWRALILYPDALVERIPAGYANLVELTEIHRVDISCHRGENRGTTGWELLRLIVDDGTAAVARAQRLIQAQSASGPGAKPARAMLDLVNFIETVLVYKLPQCTREEIQTMIGLTDIDLKQTRFYQDVFAEGQQDGIALGVTQGISQGISQGLSQGISLGISQGLSLGENQLLLRQIRRRFGTLPQWVEDKLSQASTRQKELWGDRILDAPSLEVLFAEIGE